MSFAAHRTPRESIRRAPMRRVGAALALAVGALLAIIEVTEPYPSPLWVTGAVALLVTGLVVWADERRRRPYDWRRDGI